MTKLETVLNALNIFAKDLERATRKKRKIEREHLIAAVKIGTIIIGAVATFVPQLRIVSGILNGLQTALPDILPANAKNGEELNN